MTNSLHLPSKEIAGRLNLSVQYVRDQISIRKIMTEEEFCRRQRLRTVESNAKKRLRMTETLAAHEGSPEMGYCIGSFLGDGNIHKGVSKIDVMDEAFARAFEKALDFVSGGGRVKFHKRYVKQISFIGPHKIVSEGMHYLVWLCDKAAAKFFKDRINEAFVLPKSPEFISSFLRGVFDSDGSVPRRELNPSRWAVEVSLVEKYEIDLVSKCLNRLGINHRIYVHRRPEGQRLMYRAVIRAHKDILRFSEIVGFNTSHRRDRLWQMVHSIWEGGVKFSDC